MNETAIVIDDDELVNESLTNLLEFMEIKVVGRGYDGMEAVNLYSKFNPDFSLIDISMPKYDGFYAIEKIQLISKNAKLFAITGDITGDTKKNYWILLFQALFTNPMILIL